MPWTWCCNLVLALLRMSSTFSFLRMQQFSKIYGLNVEREHHFQVFDQAYQIIILKTRQPSVPEVGVAAHFGTLMRISIQLQIGDYTPVVR